MMKSEELRLNVRQVPHLESAMLPVTGEVAQGHPNPVKRIQWVCVV